MKKKVDNKYTFMHNTIFVIVDNLNKRSTSVFSVVRVVHVAQFYPCCAARVLHTNDPICFVGDSFFIYVNIYLLY